MLFYGIFLSKPILYFLPPILLIIKIITAIMAMTMKIPTPIPALKIPSMTSQLVAVSRIKKRSDNLRILFCMVSVFGYVKWITMITK